MERRQSEGHTTTGRVFPFSPLFISMPEARHISITNQHTQTRLLTRLIRFRLYSLSDAPLPTPLSPSTNLILLPLRHGPRDSTTANPSPRNPYSTPSTDEIITTPYSYSPVKTSLLTPAVSGPSPAFRFSFSEKKKDQQKKRQIPCQLASKLQTHLLNTDTCQNIHVHNDHRPPSPDVPLQTNPFFQSPPRLASPRKDRSQCTDRIIPSAQTTRNPGPLPAHCLSN